MRGSLCCLLLTLFAWGCGPEEGKKVELKDLMFKCVITNPVEDEVIRVNINGKEQVFEVPENGVVINTYSKDDMTKYVIVNYTENEVTDKGTTVAPESAAVVGKGE